GSVNLTLGANITSPDSVVSTDNPGIQIVQNSSGDGFYAETTATGIGLRCQTAGNGDEGIRIDNGVANASNPHKGLHITEFGTNSSGASLTLERKTSSTSPLLTVLDDNASGSPAPAFPVSLRIKDSAFGTNAQYLLAGDS